MRLFFSKKVTSLRLSNRPKENEGELLGGGEECRNFDSSAVRSRCVNADARGGGKCSRFRSWFSSRHFSKSKPAPRCSLKLQRKAASGFRCFPTPPGPGE